MIINLSKCDIEQIAEDIIRDFYGTETFGVYPVDIFKMASEYFKLNIVYETLSDNEEVLGITAYQSTWVKLRRNGKFEIVPLPERTVLIEEKLRHGKKNRGRIRFTVAHECSHHVFFRLFKPQAEYCFRKQFEEDRTYTVVQLDHMARWSERKANELAASLLMPIPMLGELVKVFGIQGMKVYGDSRMILKDRQAVMAAAECIGVSKQALLIRLKQLKFLDMRPENEYPGTSGLNIWKDEKTDD